MEREFLNSNVNKEKQKALQKIKGDTEKLRKQKHETKLAEKIYYYWYQYKNFTDHQKKMFTIFTKNLQDIETLKKMLDKKNSNNEFRIPLNTLNDLISKAFFLFEKKSRIYCKKSYASYLETLFVWVLKSLNSLKEEENIYWASLKSYYFSENLYFSNLKEIIFSAEPKKQKKQPNIEFLQVRCFINIKKLIRLIQIYFIELNGFNIEVPINILNYFFNTKTIFEKFHCKDRFVNIPKMVLFYESLYEKTKYFKLLKYLFTKTISMKKDLSYNPLIESLLNISLFPFFLYQNTQQSVKDKIQYNKSFEIYLLNQNNFLFEILSLPRLGYFLVEFIQKKLSKENQCNGLLFWKTVYQAYVFSLKNPLSTSEADHEFFEKNKKRKEDILYILGNTIEILECLLKNNWITNNDLFAIVKWISLSLEFVTPKWLEMFTGLQLPNEKELWHLRGQILKLFEENVSIQLLSNIFDFEKNNFNFDSNIPITISQIYAKLIRICMQREETVLLMSKFVNSLAFKKTIMVNLWSYLNNLYGLKNFLYGKLAVDDYNHFINILTVFIVGYYHFLMITDISDFRMKNFFPVKNLCEMIIFLISYISEILWFYDKNSSTNTPEMIICTEGSKLLNLLFEFNSKAMFMPKEAWFLPENKLEILEKEIKSGNLIHLLLMKKLSFSLPFEMRLFLLKRLIQEEKEKNQNYDAYTLRIRRNYIIEDGYESFKKVMNPKGVIRVFYIDEFDMEERGIDSGGIFKEFLNDLINIVFDPNYGLFQVTETDKQLCINPHSKLFLGNDHLDLLNFVGMVVGRAIYDNILIGALFAPFFLRRMIGKLNFLAELESLDPELYKSLKFIMDYKGDLSDLGVYFTLSDKHDSTKEIELIPGGKNILIDNNNKIKYLYSVANYKLNEETKLQTNAFMSGLQKIVPISFLQFFNEFELQMVLSGKTYGSIDVEDLRKNTIYSGYGANDRYIKDLWEIVNAFNEQDKRLFVKFVTSCERAPLFGFSNLEPKFTIQYVSSEGDTKMPTAATCFNKLNLPKYSNKSFLKDKLLTAVQNSKGFYLT